MARPASSRRIMRNSLVVRLSSDGAWPGARLRSEVQRPAPSRCGPATKASSMPIVRGARARATRAAGSCMSREPPIPRGAAPRCERPANCAPRMVLWHARAGQRSGSAGATGRLASRASRWARDSPGIGHLAGGASVYAREILCDQLGPRLNRAHAPGLSACTWSANVSALYFRGIRCI